MVKGDCKVRDLTVREEVVKFMLASDTEHEWDANCKKVWSANGGAYPVFWHQAIIAPNVLYQCCLRQAADYHRDREE